MRREGEPDDEASKIIHSSVGKSVSFVEVIPISKGSLSEVLLYYSSSTINYTVETAIVE